MSQKALILPEKGGEWTVDDRSIPEPGPAQIVVKTQAVALNPVDWKIRKHGLIVTEYPAILGIDAAGVVHSVGADVTTFKPGDKVALQHHSAYQQYLAIDAELVTRVPDSFSLDEAASIPLGFFTAALALYSSGSAALPPPWEAEGQTLFKNKPIFIIGGASSVGQYVIQLAKLAGHSPIITTASAHNVARLTALGATHVLPRTLAQADALARLAELTAGAPIPLVYDAVSQDATVALGYAALAPRGTLVLVEPATPFLREAHTDGRRVVSVFASVFQPALRPLAVELYKRLPGWLERGVIKPNAVEVLPGGLAGVPAGLERMEAGKVSGTKLVVRPQETP